MITCTHFLAWPIKISLLRLYAVVQLIHTLHLWRYWYPHTTPMTLLIPTHYTYDVIDTHTLHLWRYWYPPTTPMTLLIPTHYTYDVIDTHTLHLWRYPGNSYTDCQLTYIQGCVCVPAYIVLLGSGWLNFLVQGWGRDGMLVVGEMLPPPPTQVNRTLASVCVCAHTF